MVGMVDGVGVIVVGVPPPFLDLKIVFDRFGGDLVAGHVEEQVVVAHDEQVDDGYFVSSPPRMLLHRVGPDGVGRLGGAGGHRREQSRHYE